MTDKHATLKAIKHLLSINDLALPEGYVLSPAKLQYITAIVDLSAWRDFLEDINAHELAFKDMGQAIYYVFLKEKPCRKVTVYSPPIEFVEALVTDDRCYDFQAHVQDGLIRLPSEVLASALKRSNH